MKLLKQDGMSLKPVIIMLAIMGGLVYYMMEDLKKIKSSQPVIKTKLENIPVLDSPPETKSTPHEINIQAKESVEPSPHKIPIGSICGVVNFECRGSFVGDNLNIPPQQAINVDSTYCEGHKMNEPQCVFVDFQKGFRLEGLNCPDGYRPMTHAGHFDDSENGEGATKTTNLLQLLMVMCVKQ